MEFNSNIKKLQVYEAGKPIELVVREFGISQGEIIKLASNENPLGTSPKVVDLIAKMASMVNLYPDDSYYELKDELANLYKVSSKNIIIGSGSDQIINFAIHTKTNPNTAVLMAGATFAMYEIYAKQTGAKIIKTTSKTHDINEFKKLYETHKNEISVIFLCLPNNPLGECLDANEVYDFLKNIRKDVLVILDCAYMEFATFKDKNKKIDPKNLIDKFDNALYLGTFSKAYGLGGMRVGYGIANEEIITALHKLRPPFNVTTLSLQAAIKALQDTDFIKKTLENNLEQMKIYEEFAIANNINFIPSYTNFITFFFDAPLDSTKISDNLLKKAIIIRNLKNYGLNAVRITIGTKEQNKKVLEKLKKEL